MKKDYFEFFALERSSSLKRYQVKCRYQHFFKEARTIPHTLSKRIFKFPHFKTC